MSHGLQAYLLLLISAEAAEETHGDWRVMCENGICNAYQVGTGGAAPVIGV